MEFCVIIACTRKKSQLFYFSSMGCSMWVLDGLERQRTEDVHGNKALTTYIDGVVAKNLWFGKKLLKEYITFWKRERNSFASCHAEGYQFDGSL